MGKYFLIYLLLALPLSCQVQPNEPKDDSIDIKTISSSLTLFGENVISTPLYERDLAISPNGDELIYTLGDYRQNRRCLVSSKVMDGKWSKPQVLSVSGEYQDIEPFYSLSEDRLYFASNRPIYNDAERNDYNIWYSDRIQHEWSAPIPLDSTINTRGNEFYPSLSKNGNLYFTATRENGIGKEDIFMAEFIEGKFQQPKPLPSEVNTLQYEFNGFISPNEDYIIFSSYGREDDLGGGDLYLSEKDQHGHWTRARNLGNKINSDKLDYCPFVDTQSKNFYFTSERIDQIPGKLVSVDSLKEFANRIENGFGNIYKISFEALRVKSE